ncbi:MAG: hypothetical protein L6437_01205, partial [Kiritimatiellae bacterium]|nr:hypothetical protein [Kiritimatiellia bacterium]
IMSQRYVFTPNPFLPSVSSNMSQFAEGRRRDLDWLFGLRPVIFNPSVIVHAGQSYFRPMCMPFCRDWAALVVQGKAAELTSL